LTLPTEPTGVFSCTHHTIKKSVHPVNIAFSKTAKVILVFIYKQRHRISYEEADGRREEGKKNSLSRVLLPTPERKKFG
jgi:hypothetical protein